MDSRKKLEILKGSLESGIIDKEQFEKEKKKLESDVKEFDKKIKEINRAEVNEKPTKSSEVVLLITITIIFLLLAAILAFSYFYKQKPKTIEELHILNLQGKLNPSQGYLYKGIYSFIILDNVWYTQLSSPKGTKVYNLALRYSPRDLKEIVIEGSLDGEFFNNQTEFYVTFNPTGRSLQYVGLAVADFDVHMLKVFEKTPIPACDRNETDVCKKKSITTCDDTDKLVLYIKEAEKFRVYYKNNCIVVEGNGIDLVKGVDRILYNLYNLMGQEEA